MELFPAAQPDLSLQISPPNSKPSSGTGGGWIRRSSSSSEDQDEMDLGFWKRALDSRNSSAISSSRILAKPHPPHPPPSLAPENSSSSFELSLSTNNYPRLSSDPNHYNHFNLIHNTTNNNSNHLIHSSFHHQGLTQELGFLRPIRGIPVYQNPAATAAALSSSFPFLQHSLLDNTTTNTTTTTTTCNNSTIIPSSSTSTNHSHHHHHQGLMRSRILSRFPAKRSMRAPRMRWTTTLHARFVHAVELLGGHESKLSFFLS